MNGNSEAIHENLQLCHLSWKEIAEKLANELVSVQPIDVEFFGYHEQCGKDVDDLLADGYNPVSRIGLLYIKGDD